MEGRIFWNDDIMKKECDIKLFLETDFDLMLSRRVYKGLASGQELDDIIEKYLKFVKPNYE